MLLGGFRHFFGVSWARVKQDVFFINSVAGTGLGGSSVCNVIEQSREQIMHPRKFRAQSRCAHSILLNNGLFFVILRLATLYDRTVFSPAHSKTWTGTSSSAPARQCAWQRKWWSQEQCSVGGPVRLGQSGSHKEAQAMRCD